MAAVHRFGDVNTAGGAINTIPQSRVFANNKLLAVNGSRGTGDSSCNNNNNHCGGNWQTTNGCTRVFAGGIEVNRAGDKDSCGHGRSETASPDVFICAGGQASAGALLDQNPPYLGNTNTISPIDAIPAGGQPQPGKPNYTDITLADVHVYENNNDDPDDTLGSQPPLTYVKPDIDTIETDLTPPPVTVPPVYNCATINALPASFNWSAGSPAPADFDDWANNPGTYPEVQLSSNYTVGDLTINTAVSYYEFTTNVNQANGMSQKAILQNLCYMANTLLEPLRADGSVPTFTITSAYRNKSGSSQHNQGQAVDLQFLSYHGSGSTKDQYFAIAQYIRDNYEFDQLILEWFGRNPWIHISIDSTGLRNNVLTQTSSNSYTTGLLKIG